MAAIVVGVCILTPQLAPLFAFEAPPPALATVAVATALANAIVFDLAKLLPPVRRLLQGPTREMPEEVAQ